MIAHTNMRRLVIIGSSVAGLAVALVLAFAGGAESSPDVVPTAPPDVQLADDPSLVEVSALSPMSDAPLADLTAAQQANLERLTSVPPDLPAQYQSDAPGEAVYAKARLLISDPPIVAVPTANNQICLDIGNGNVGVCYPRLGKNGIAWTVHTSTEDGSSDSQFELSVSGITADRVARLELVRNGITDDVRIQNNAFFYRAPSGTQPTDLEALVVTYVDGSTTTDTLQLTPAE